MSVTREGVLTMAYVQGLSPEQPVEFASREYNSTHQTRPPAKQVLGLCDLLQRILEGVGCLDLYASLLQVAAIAMSTFLNRGSRAFSANSMQRNACSLHALGSPAVAISFWAAINCDKPSAWSQRLGRE
jgi:hypothetical protein